MAWFFTHDQITTEYYAITGEDAMHISHSLRMKAGEQLTLCNPNGLRYESEIKKITRDEVIVKIYHTIECEQEPDVKVSLFVGLLKGHKFESVVKRAVELGAYEITPFISARCISRPEAKNIVKKIARWQKIAENAASQSRRGILPQVNPCIDIRDIPQKTVDMDKAIVFYECGGEKLRKLLPENCSSIALVTGTEGGFEQEEIDFLCENGIEPATLGKRILRAQTAPVAGLCATMLLTGNLE